MQAVINGITYDTDTARVLAGWRGKLDPDFKGTFEEFVYVTPEGRTFVAGERRGDLSRLMNAQGTGFIRPVPGTDRQILAVMRRNAGALKGSRRNVRLKT
jgi:hypothetical protein